MYSPQTSSTTIAVVAPAVVICLNFLLKDEKLMSAEMANKKPLVMMPEDWHQYNSATECHICNESLFKPQFRDTFTMHHHGQSHKKCYYQAWKGFIGPLRERKPNGPNGWINEIKQEDCIFCERLLLVNNYKDLVKDHCHIIGKYHC